MAYLYLLLLPLVMLMIILILYRDLFAQWYDFSCSVDLGGTRSFVYLALSKKFCDDPRTLNFPLEVEIADDRTVSASRVHRGCVLSLFSKRSSIDLVPIHLRGSKVIIEMDSLGPNEATTNYFKWQLVRFRTLSGGELIILGDRALHGPTLCSARRARRYL